MDEAKTETSNEPATPKWSEDFPIEWEGDHYVTRRELAKFLTLGSALLVGASTVIALVGRLRRLRPTAARRIGSASALASGDSLLFRYPTSEDPCILVRTKDGHLAAYSQVCTHLSCAVIFQPANDRLFCPCHNGSFSCTEGRPISGPPTRRLPQIKIEQRGDDLFAVGVEV